jgi:hypothetical protein
MLMFVVPNRRICMPMGRVHYDDVDTYRYRYTGRELRNHMHVEVQGLGQERVTILLWIAMCKIQTDVVPTTPLRFYETLSSLILDLERTFVLNRWCK